MKGNKKILVAAILLLLIAVSYGTYAIYKSSISGTATAKIAKWAVVFKDGGTTLTDTLNVEFTADDCANEHVATGYIAPGATCTKDITIDATGTQVDVTYEVDTTGTVLVNGSAVNANANQFTAGIAGSDHGTILMSGTQTATVTVELEWGGIEGSPYDAADTAIGEHGGDANDAWTVTVPVTLTAKQMVSGS